MVWENPQQKDIALSPISSHVEFTQMGKDQGLIQMRAKLYQVGLAVRDLAFDPEFSKNIINATSENDYHIALLENVFNDNPDYLDHVNAELLSIKSEFGNSEGISIKESNIQEIANSLKYKQGEETHEYKLSIFIINGDNMDTSLPPLVSSGVYVNGDLYPELDEYIYAWKLEANGQFAEILINEEQSLNLKNPIFAIDNAQEEMASRRKMESNFEGNMFKGMKSITQFHSNEYKINYAYESSGYSEFCIIAGIIRSSTEWGLILRDSYGSLLTWTELSSCASGDIGDDMQNWNFISDEYTPYYSVYAYFNCFERDWARSNKTLGVSATQYGKNLYFDERMENSGDWYAFDPSNSLSTTIDYQSIYSNWSKQYTFESSKGYLKFWRCEL